MNKIHMEEKKENRRKSSEPWIEIATHTIFPFLGENFKRLAADMVRNDSQVDTRRCVYSEKGGSVSRILCEIKKKKEILASEQFEQFEQTSKTTTIKFTIDFTLRATMRDLEIASNL